MVIVAAHIVINRAAVPISVAGAGVAAARGHDQEPDNEPNNHYGDNHAPKRGTKIGAGTAGRLVKRCSRNRGWRRRIANGDLRIAGNGVSHSASDDLERTAILEFF